MALQFALDAVLELAVALGKVSNDRIVANRDIRQEQRSGHPYGVAKREPVGGDKGMSIRYLFLKKITDDCRHPGSFANDIPPAHKKCAQPALSKDIVCVRLIHEASRS
jgi:hypothetical protein